MEDEMESCTIWRKSCRYLMTVMMMMMMILSVMLSISSQNYIQRLTQGIYFGSVTGKKNI